MTAAPPAETTAADDPASGDEPSKGMRTLIELGMLVVGAVLLAGVIKTFVFQAFYIPSESMEPTLQINDRVLVNKLAYALHDPERGDIVVFEAPDGEATAQIKDLVKRIIGLPGDVVEMRDGVVYIDGAALDEPYLRAPSTKDFAPCEVPAGTYFMMGDNRDRSKDSRYFGPIPRGEIVGRVFVRIWPLGSITFYSEGPTLERQHLAAGTPIRGPAQGEGSAAPSCGDRAA